MDDFLGRNFFLSRRLRGCIGRSLFADDSAGHFGAGGSRRSLEAAPALGIGGVSSDTRMREIGGKTARFGFTSPSAIVFSSVFFDRSAKRSLLRESKARALSGADLRDADGCPACPPARHLPLFFALGSLCSWLGLPPCEQQQTGARGRFACCSFAARLRCHCCSFKISAHGPSSPKPGPCYCTGSCRWTAS